MKREKKRRPSEEATCVCDACGEEIVVPVGGQAAVPGKQHARQPLVSAVAARSRGPGQEKSGPDHLRRKKLEKELADINKETRKLTARLKVLDRRRAELMKELGG